MNSNCQMNVLVRVMLCIAVLLVSNTILYAEADRAGGKISVGIFVNSRSAAVEQIAKTLKAEGFDVGTFDGKDASAGKIYSYDVVFFGGGWKGYNWLNLAARMHLVEYVQKRGGGAIFSMFRCGWAARSGIRPTFPEVAHAYNKSNGSGIVVVNKTHPITKGLPEKYLTPYFDHAVMKLGRAGKVLAVDTNNDVALCCGEAGKGKVVFIGQWIGISREGKEVYPLDPVDKQILLNSIRWAASGQRVRGDGKISDETRLLVLRRELIMDWTNDERAVTSKFGILTQAMYLLAEKIDDLSFRAERLAAFAEDAKTTGKLLKIRQKLSKLNSQLQRNYKAAKARKIADINRLSLKEIKQYKPGTAHSPMLPAGQLKSLEEDVAGLENLLADGIRKSKEKRFAEERLQDTRRVPKLVAQLKSKDAGLREKAALELGRIGDKGTIQALISALPDKHYPVRRNAIYALGWMRVRESIPALLKISGEAKDNRTRRRVTEALGIIGDSRAAGYLLKALKDSDYFVRQNAILSLGWLGEKKAVKPLVRILEEDEKAGWTEQDLTCAIRALGHIGDASAIPALKSVRDRHPYKPVRDLYATQLKIPKTVGLALEEIKNGGRKEKGITQPDFLKDRKNFYWLTGKYNAIYGRYFSYGGHPKDVNVMANAAASSGGTGFISWNTSDMIEARFPGGDRYMKHFSELGLKNVPCWHWRGSCVLDKAGFERDVLRWGKYPALGGFWAEEALGWSVLGNDAEFRDYLLRKYSPGKLAGFGIADIRRVKCPASTDEGRKQKFLFAEYMEYIADKGVDIWEETQDWLTALHKGMPLLFNLSQRYSTGSSTYISAYPRVTQVIGVNGPQSYGAHSYANNFRLEMVCDGEVRPALGEFYAHQADTPGRVERGFASSFIHGQCFFVWGWNYVYRHTKTTMGWDKGKWEAAQRQFRKGKAISDYLVPAKSPKLITQLYSGRTTTLSYSCGSPDAMKGGRMYRYTQNQGAIWESILQSHLPVDITWMETLSNEKLARYRIVVLSDGRSLSKEEVNRLRNWVKQGGVLIATGGTSLHDQWDRPMKNYALADVFGVDYVKSLMAGSAEERRRYVERDIKPDKGIERIQIKDQNYIKHMEGKRTAEYEKRIGFDSVKTTTGKVVGVWQDGTPAVIENKYGKGWCIFLSPVSPGLSHITGGWTVDDLYKDFWDGSRELVAGCLRRAMELGNTELPLEVKNCPARVEAALKKQDKSKRWMVHLLNYDPKITLVKGVEVKLRLPAGKSVARIYYVYPDKQDIAYKLQGNCITFTMRDFDIHEMAVVEFK